MPWTRLVIYRWLAFINIHVCTMKITETFLVLFALQTPLHSTLLKDKYIRPINKHFPLISFIFSYEFFQSSCNLDNSIKRPTNILYDSSMTCRRIWPQSCQTGSEEVSPHCFYVLTPNLAHMFPSMTCC